MTFGSQRAVLPKIMDEKMTKVEGSVVGRHAGAMLSEIAFAAAFALPLM